MGHAVDYSLQHSQESSFEAPQSGSLDARARAVARIERLLGDASSQRLNDITNLAAAICDTPTAFFSLVGAERQVVPAAYEIDIECMPIEESICQATVRQRSMLVIEDTRLDSRFSGLPCVVGEPNIIFYAGVPVFDPESNALGALCVADFEPRSLDDHQLESLVKLARLLETNIALITSRDLARKQADELREQNSVFQIVGHHSPELFWIYETSSNTLEYINSAIERIYGVDREALLNDPGLWVQRIVSQDDRENLSFQLRTMPDRMDARYRVPDRFERVRWLHTRTFPIPQTSRVVGVTLDITEQVRNEEEQRAALSQAQEAVLNLEESRLRAFESANFLSLYFDVEGQIYQSNDAANDLLSSPGETLVGESIWSLFEDEFVTTLRRHLREASDEARVFSDIHVHRVADNKSLPADLWIESICVNREPTYQLRIRDMSELAQARKQLQETHERLVASQKFEALGKLAGGIAHDFNNMLSIIKTYAQFAYQEIEQEDPVREDMNSILDAVERSSQLTQKLLSFGRHQDASESLDVDLFASELCDVFSRTLSHVKIETDLNADGAHLTIANADLQQILMNLVMNAADALKGTGGTIGVSTRIHQNFVDIRVADDGPGMPESVRAQIFEPFFTTKDATGGTGLGLTTVYSLVEQLGGRIEVQSTLDQGTLFTVKLPTAGTLSSSTAVDDDMDYEALHED